ncbi:MAG TPA: hypothetical protein VLH09_14280 [Bryobacteraceae bacterium]|nr:hypothetical protein [Bryobacteraceae bacterium]
MKRALPSALPVFIMVAVTLSLASCGAAPAPPPAKRTVQVEAPPPREEWHRFPKADMIETKLIETQLMGKRLMPGGTLGRCKQANTEYETFICRPSSADDAKLVLAEWKAVMTNPQLIYSFAAASARTRAVRHSYSPRGRGLPGYLARRRKRRSAGPVCWRLTWTEEDERRCHSGTGH